MSRRTLEVELSGVGSLVRGYGSRGLLTEATGRPPVWIPRLRGWSCQEHTARDVVALAEAKGYDIVITGPRRKQASTSSHVSDESGDSGVTPATPESAKAPLW